MVVLLREFYERLKNEEEIPVKELCEMSYGLNFTHYQNNGHLKNLKIAELDVTDLCNLLVPKLAIKEMVIGNGYSKNYNSIRITDNGWDDLVSTLDPESLITVLGKLGRAFLETNDVEKQEAIATLSDVIFVTVMDKIGPELTIANITNNKGKHIFVGCMYLFEYMYTNKNSDIQMNRMYHTVEDNKKVFLYDINQGSYEYIGFYVPQGMTDLMLVSFTNYTKKFRKAIENAKTT